MADFQALLATLDGESDVGKLKSALRDITTLLEPLLELGKGRPSIDALRSVARVQGPVVTSLIKSMGSRLSPDVGHSHEQFLVFGDAALLALNAIDCLRPILKASQHELDVQRYNFVRKLASHGLHEHAMAQGKVLLASVAASPGTVAGPGDLHIAAVANLLVCYSALVKQGSSRAEALWRDIHVPLDNLLSLARDAGDPHEAAKRLDLVLKCLSKVVETLQYASVVCNLSPAAVAQQLTALTSCGALCRQEQAVQQMLVDDAAAAADAVKLALTGGLVHLIMSEGSMSEHLIPMLHQLVVSLGQKRTGPVPPIEDRLYGPHPLAVLVHAALTLPHCSLKDVPDVQLRGVIISLAAVTAKFSVDSEESCSASCRLRWCCLDGLRVSVAGILTQLLSAPQAAGGSLPVLAQYMELMCGASLAMMERGGPADAALAFSSGASAISIAIRIQVAHAFCTGQLSALREDMSRYVELLKRLLIHPKELHRPGGSNGVEPSVLQSLSASLGNAGLDLLHVQHAAPAAVLLHAAADLAFERVRYLRASGCMVSETDVSQLIKKCKAHIVALQQLSLHDEAMAAAAACVGHLHTCVEGKAHLLLPLIKHFVQSSLASFDSALAAAASMTATTNAPQTSSAISGGANTAAPAAPCKAQRRSARLQRMQPDARLQDSQALEKSSTQTIVGETAAIGGHSVAAKPASVAPRALVQFLAATAVREKGGRSGLISALDTYAVLELEVLREESKRRDEGDNLQSLYNNAVLGTLHACANAAGDSEILRARELLVKAVTSIASLEAQISDLRTSCGLLDTYIAEIQTEPLHAAVLGMLDSAALAHAQLGLCLAQWDMQGRKCVNLGQPTDLYDDTEASNHVRQAITLWSRLLAARAEIGADLPWRTPQATFHTALQVQQFVHLHGIGHAEASHYSSDVIWRLMRSLEAQVKLREQHIYLLCTTMPFTTCTAWLLAAEPTMPLADVFKDAQYHRKVAEVRKVTEACREAYATNPIDHVGVATITSKCAMELERSGFLRHGPAPLLLRSQCHQLAAAAYLRAGKTSLAYVHAQESLRITCSLFMLLNSEDISLKGGSARTNGTAASDKMNQCNLTPAKAAAATVKSGAVTSALDYAADEPGSNEEQQSCGEASDAIKPLATTGSLEMRSGRGLTVGLAWAVVAAHLTSLHSAARVFEAAGCAEDALCLWRECSRTAELFGVTGVLSLCSSYLAELSCRRGDAEAAATHLETAVATTCTDKKECIGQDDLHAVEAALLAAHVCSARARLTLLRQLPDQADEAAQEGLNACGIVVSAAHRNVAIACGQTCSERAPSRSDALIWHGGCLRAQLERMRAEASLQLGRRQEAVHLLEGTLGQLEQAAKTCYLRSAAEVWPVDYGLLLAHRAFAMPLPAVFCDNNASVVGMGDWRAANCSVKHSSDQVSYSSTSDTSAGSSGADQSSKKGGKGKANGALRQGVSKQQQQQQHPHPHSQDVKRLDDTYPTSRSDTESVYGSIAVLLQSLQLCWQLPLAAMYACRKLLYASMALGLPYAATMFLHLGQGMSYTQEQALQRESRRYACQRHRQPQNQDASDSRTESTSSCSGTAEGLEPGRTSEPGNFILTADIRDAALSMLSGIQLDGAGSPSALMSLESGAQVWLHQALNILPEDVVISCIIQDTQAGQLLVGRTARGGAPLLAVLPRPAAGTTACMASHVLDRCVVQLHQLLEESGDSMHMDQDVLSSQNHKVKWWKTRVSLDDGVKGLLQELDEQVLGPWRCFLLPAFSAHLGVWRAAADAFMKEHFLSVQGQSDGISNENYGDCTGVLRELLVVVLSGMRHLQKNDLAVLLGVVCSQLRLRDAPSYVNTLVVELLAAEAATRVQLLKLLPAEHCAGSSSMGINGVRCEETSPGSRLGLPAARSRAAAPPTARAHPSAACTAPQGTLAGTRLGARESSWRPVHPPCHAAAESLDANSTAQHSVGTIDTHGIARRGLRPAPTQAEPSSQAVASKGASRGLSARLVAHSRLSAMAITKDHSTECSKATVARGTTKALKTLEGKTDTATSTTSEPVYVVQPVAGPVLLVLSPELHALPWESIPCCHGNNLYRILNLPVACATASQRTGTAPMCVEGGGIGSTPEQAGDHKATPSAFFVLNPNGDLVDTQRFFQPILEAQPRWKGITGEQPSPQAILAALQSHNLFLYFGHGSGEQFLPLPALRKLQRCSSCLLMGCSSGRLRMHGAYDPTGAAVAYLLAGCPALVANLWDVTDRDIDRYSQVLMHAWLGCAPAQPTVTGGREPLGLAVAHSRTACKLTFLNGAAPVCYGLPLSH